MQIEESKYKCEIQNFLFLINDNISFTKAYFTLNAPRNIITKYLNSQHLVS